MTKPKTDVVPNQASEFIQAEALAMTQAIGVAADGFVTKVSLYFSFGEVSQPTQTPPYAYRCGAAVFNEILRLTQSHLPPDAAAAIAGHYATAVVNKIAAIESRERGQA